MIKAGYSENQFYNMRRNNMDMLVLIGLFVLRLLTASSGSDDDEDDTFAGLAYYFTGRLFREQAAFNLPSHLYEEAQNLANVSPVGPSAAASIFNLSRLFVGSLVVSDKDNATYYYQGNLEGVYEKGQPKYQIKLRKMTPYVKSLYVFKNPYKAAASYDYGRRLRTR